MFKRRKASLNLARKALKAYQNIPIKFINVSLERALELAHAQNMYAYDAYLIQCAQQTSTSLLTLDNGMKIVAEKMGVEVLEIE